MKTFQIEVQRTITTFASTIIEIEAENAEQAMDIACNMGYDDQLDFPIDTVEEEFSAIELSDD